jgi:hypothetical protein
MRVNWTQFAAPSHDAQLSFTIASRKAAFWSPGYVRTTGCTLRGLRLGHSRARGDRSALPPGLPPRIRRPSFDARCSHGRRSQPICFAKYFYQLGCSTSFAFRSKVIEACASLPKPWRKQWTV